MAELSPSNWGGEYAPCDRHADLLRREHLELAVRISTLNGPLAEQFQRAVQFWSGVLDLDWHVVDSQPCSLQLVDGKPSLFNWCVCMSARSQLPDRENFQGWIAFNPRFKLSKREMFLDSVHEIGHVLGLTHNPDESSVMSSFGTTTSAWLDAADLNTLASKHALRPGIIGFRTSVPVEPPVQSAGRRVKRTPF
jgi:Matrixin